MKAAHITVGILALILGVAAFVLFLAGIWTSGNQPLSDRLVLTGCLCVFPAVILAGMWAAMWDVRR